MALARICLECLFANVKTQQLLPYAPIASNSTLLSSISRKGRRTYSTRLQSEGESRPSPSPSRSAEPPQSDVQQDPPRDGAYEGAASKGKHPLEDTKMLALARWSALRQSARLALERQQHDLRQKLGEASARINDISGYKEIEALKAEVTRKELELLEARAAAREAKEAYSTALNDRMASSREVNDLLQRKNNWLESDVSRFTELVRQDHLNEHRERDKKIEVTREEEAVERKIGEMMQAILKRYHEEQVWSDKIRSLSTYGTLAITCINVLIFLLALTLVEPWKRRRMVSEVEGRLRDRDDQQSLWLGNQLDELKTLVQESQPQALPSGIRGLAPLASQISNASHDQQGAQAEDHGDVISSTPMHDPIPLESNIAPPHQVSKEGTASCDHHVAASAETVRCQSGLRDAYYAGAVGALLGAATVSLFSSVFR